MNNIYAYIPQPYSFYSSDTPIDFLVPGAHFADLEKNAMRGYAAPRVEMLKCQYCRSFAPWGTTHCPQCGAPVQY